MAYPETLRRLIEELNRLPGIGEKSAERIAFHLLKRPESEVLSLAESIRDLRTKALACSQCANVSDMDPCGICRDPGRDAGVICVVEQSKDLWAIENAGTYRGTYHVLQGHVAPLEGIGPEHLTIALLAERVRRGGVREVIFATNPNLEGDGTALWVQKALEGTGARLTRLARGIPAGSQLEYASRAILVDAIEGRREL